MTRTGRSEWPLRFSVWVSPGWGVGDDLGLMVVESRTDADVYAAYADELVRFATGLVGPADAQDVVAEAVIRVMSSPVWEEANNRRALLYRAVWFEARSLQRSAARRRAREVLAVGREVVDPPEPRPDVWRAVSVLSPQQRAVVFLTYWEDLNPRSIAEVLEISEGTVRRHLARARRRLKGVLHG